MSFSNSSLVNHTHISPNKNIGRIHSIDTVTIHCVVGQCSVETLGNIFADANREASSNYGIGYDGRIGMYVEEKDRSWCTSSSYNDNRAVTIEVASDMYDPYRINDAAYRSLILLLADICRRNGIKALSWSTNASDRMNHVVNMTAHRDYANKSCPGDYIYEREGQIAAEVNKLLGSTTAAATTNASTSSTKTNGTAAIKEVQTWLNTYGYGLETDGIYGYYTRTALAKTLQRELNKKYNAGLAVDGVFGPATRAAVVNLKSGYISKLVTVLQGFLICNGYDTGGLDGIFGEKTEQAVRAYQKSKGLDVDGIAGKDTFSALSK
jgi:peptidoglycan hydrolase-like protein with peptidoglycan-binding domain